MRKLIFILLLTLVWTSAIAQDVSVQTERKQRIEEEITFINNQLKNLSSKQKASTAQLNLIQKKVANRKVLLTEVDRQLADIQAKIQQKRNDINLLQRELDTLQLYYENLIYNTYKNRDAKVWFMYVLASEDIGEGYRRYAYLKELAGAVNTQGEKIKEKKSALEQEREALLNMRKEAQQIRITREKEYKKFIAEEASSKKNLKNLSKTQSQYRKELAQKKREVEKLNREIERILNSTVAQQKKDMTQIDVALSAKFEQNKGKLPWPVKQGTITEQFGVHFHPVYKNLKMPQNNGVTFTTPKNAEVFCVFDGVIRQIVMMPGYNQCVLVQHGEYFTFYCKLTKVFVKSGDKVSTGDSIGSLDTDTKNSSSLHFQIWKGTVKQNPESWLRY